MPRPSGALEGRAGAHTTPDSAWLCHLALVAPLSAWPHVVLCEPPTHRRWGYAAPYAPGGPLGSLGACGGAEGAPRGRRVTFLRPVSPLGVPWVLPPAPRSARRCPPRTHKTSATTALGHLIRSLNSAPPHRPAPRTAGPYWPASGDHLTSRHLRVPTALAVLRAPWAYPALATSRPRRLIRPSSTPPSTRPSRSARGDPCPAFCAPPHMTKSACPDAPRGLSRAAGCSAPCHCFPKSLTPPCRPSAIVLPRPALLGLATAPATRRCALSPNPGPRPSAQPQATHRCSTPPPTA